MAWYVVSKKTSLAWLSIVVVGIIVSFYTWSSWNNTLSSFGLMISKNNTYETAVETIGTQHSFPTLYQGDYLSNASFIFNMLNKAPQKPKNINLNMFTSGDGEIWIDILHKHRGLYSFDQWKHLR
jgi:hypothetical protein